MDTIMINLSYVTFISTSLIYCYKLLRGKYRRVQPIDDNFEENISEKSITNESYNSENSYEEIMDYHSDDLNESDDLDNLNDSDDSVDNEYLNKIVLFLQS